jgi:hypothetical protein
MARISHEGPSGPDTSSASAVRPSTSSITSKISNLSAPATDGGELDEEDAEESARDDEEDDAPGMVHMTVTRGWSSASSTWVISDQVWINSSGSDPLFTRYFISFGKMPLAV